VEQRGSWARGAEEQRPRGSEGFRRREGVNEKAAREEVLGRLGFEKILQVRQGEVAGWALLGLAGWEVAFRWAPGTDRGILKKKRNRSGRSSLA
jgi:hypothetical protein